MPQNAALTKRERLEKTFAGEPTDRAPVSLWRHWPGDDQRPGDLVAATVAFQRQYDWDFVKFTPASSFCITDFGVQDRWVGNLEGTREYTKHAVSRSLDWTELRVLDPTKGALARQVEAVGLLKSALGDEAPILQTIFSPLAQAKNISGEATLLTHMRTDPNRLITGLNTITESILRFLDALRRSGLSGIFYAVQHASYALMSEEEYRTFGRPYDLRILQALNRDWWFNMLHLHGDAPMFDLVTDYPVQSLNWHDRETDPDLATGKRKFRGAVCGGLGHWDSVHNGTPAEVRAQARDAFEKTDGKRFILSTGCVAMITSPSSNLRAVRDVVDGTA
ncbi:MAG TPA: uroporphyrinogen decarboxylase family protein [Aggregatilineales bacterium]|nr:uroporphyrinogen decarboxylase family protein [Aggregatilineales bacterium]